MKTFLLAFAALMILTPAAYADTAKASFAMGCFWCAEHDFEKVKGVTDVVSGYEGGTKETATYDQVSSGITGHFETVEITFDPKTVTYEKLLQVFWDNIDPFDGEGQFCDKGHQYSAVIFASTADERAKAEKSLKDLQARHADQKVTVQILDAKPFYAAEDHHQNYADTNSVRYKMYRSGCGRDNRLGELREK